MENELVQTEKNPLNELSELRIEIVQQEDYADLICLVRFGTATLHFKGRSYQIGFNSAQLTLTLEGWRTAIGHDLGDQLMGTILQSDSLTKTVSKGVGLNGSIGHQVNPKMTADAKAGAEFERVSELVSSSSLAPVKALPNGSWLIENNALDEKRRVLTGTAIGGKKLCRIKEVFGSNKSEIFLELIIDRKCISIEPSTGNKIGKKFSVRKNKDAIVAKILEKAMAREVARFMGQDNDEYFVASKIEIAKQ